MSTNYILYNENGTICRTGNCSESDLHLQAGVGETVMEGLANDALQYVKGGVVKMKQPLGAVWSSQQVLSDGIDEIVLDGLPIPCTVSVDGDPFLVEDGNFEFSTEDIGTYKVQVNHPEYILETWEIEADEI